MTTFGSRLPEDQFDTTQQIPFSDYPLSPDTSAMLDAGSQDVGMDGPAPIQVGMPSLSEEELLGLAGSAPMPASQMMNIPSQQEMESIRQGLAPEPFTEIQTPEVPTEQANMGGRIGDTAFDVLLSQVSGEEDKQQEEFRRQQERIPTLEEMYPQMTPQQLEAAVSEQDKTLTYTPGRRFLGIPWENQWAPGASYISDRNAREDFARGRFDTPAAKEEIQQMKFGTAPGFTTKLSSRIANGGMGILNSINFVYEGGGALANSLGLGFGDSAVESAKATAAYMAAANDNKLTGDTWYEDIALDLAEVAPQLAYQFTIGRAFGLAGSAISATEKAARVSRLLGFVASATSQSASSQFNESLNVYREAGQTEDQAISNALMDAMYAGASTSLTSALEGVMFPGIAGKSLRKAAAATTVQTIRRGIIKGGVSEATQEYIDQTATDFAVNLRRESMDEFRKFYEKNPDWMTETLKRNIYAGVLGGLSGGLVGPIGAISERADVRARAGTMDAIRGVLPADHPIRRILDRGDVTVEEADYIVKKLGDWQDRISKRTPDDTKAQRAVGAALDYSQLSNDQLQAVLIAGNDGSIVAPWSADVTGSNELPQTKTAALANQPVVVLPIMAADELVRRGVAVGQAPAARTVTPGARPIQITPIESPETLPDGTTVTEVYETSQFVDQNPELAERLATSSEPISRRQMEQILGGKRDWNNAQARQEFKQFLVDELAGRTPEARREAIRKGRRSAVANVIKELAGVSDVEAARIAIGLSPRQAKVVSSILREADREVRQPSIGPRTMLEVMQAQQDAEGVAAMRRQERLQMAAAEPVRAQSARGEIKKAEKAKAVAEARKQAMERLKPYIAEETVSMLAARANDDAEAWVETITPDNPAGDKNKLQNFLIAMQALRAWASARQAAFPMDRLGGLSGVAMDASRKFGRLPGRAGMDEEAIAEMGDGRFADVVEEARDAAIAKMEADDRAAQEDPNYVVSREDALASVVSNADEAALQDIADVIAGNSALGVELRLMLERTLSTDSVPEPNKTPDPNAVSRVAGLVDMVRRTGTGAEMQFRKVWAESQKSKKNELMAEQQDLASRLTVAKQARAALERELQPLLEEAWMTKPKGKKPPQRRKKRADPTEREVQISREMSKLNEDISAIEERMAAIAGEFDVVSTEVAEPKNVKPTQTFPDASAKKRAESIAQIRSELAEINGLDPDEVKIRYDDGETTITEREQQLIDFGNKIGVTVVMAQGPKSMRTVGAYKRGIIIINQSEVATPRAWFKIALHESMHHLANTNPGSFADLYRLLNRKVPKSLRELRKVYTRKIDRQARQKAVREAALTMLNDDSGRFETGLLWLIRNEQDSPEMQILVANLPTQIRDALDAQGLGDLPVPADNDIEVARAEFKRQVYQKSRRTLSEETLQQEEVANLAELLMDTTFVNIVKEDGKIDYDMMTRIAEGAKATSRMSQFASAIMDAVYSLGIKKKDAGLNERQAKQLRTYADDPQELKNPRARRVAQALIAKAFVQMMDMKRGRVAIDEASAKPMSKALEADEIPALMQAIAPESEYAVGEQAVRWLQDDVMIRPSDPRWEEARPYGIKPSLTADGRPKFAGEVTQANLAEAMPSGRTVFHETNRDSAKKIVARVLQGWRRYEGVYVSDNLDLALGQTGKGYVIEFDPRYVNGRKVDPAMQVPSLAFTEAIGAGTEFVMDKTLPKSLLSITVPNQRGIDALRDIPGLSKVLDFDNPVAVERGLRISRRAVVVQPKTGKTVNAMSEDSLSQAIRADDAEDLPESIDAVSGVDGVAKVASENKFQTIRDFKVSIQDAVKRAAANVGARLQNESSTAVENYIVRMGVKDAKAALGMKNNAIGWYDEKVRAAMEVMALVYPEVRDDQPSQFIMKIALAITSNQIEVERNFMLAAKAYETYQRTGSFPTNIGEGNSKAVINASMERVNRMIADKGLDWTMDFMRTKRTVREIKAMTGKKVSGEGMDTVVYGAAILGPKIGNGFFANLYGNYEQLTMDRWFMRTWGRWTGTLLANNAALVKEQRDALRTMLKGMPKSDLDKIGELIGADLADAAAGRMQNVSVIAKQIARKSTKEDFRDAMARIPGGDDLRKSANTHIKTLDGSVESPKSSSIRNRIRRLMERTLTELQKEYPDLTMADLQAVYWYPEKRLYDLAKANTSASGQDINDDLSYDDGGLPDYEQAAVAFAKNQGRSDKEISDARSRAAKMVADERAGRSRRGTSRRGEGRGGDGGRGGRGGEGEGRGARGGRGGGGGGRGRGGRGRGDAERLMQSLEAEPANYEPASLVEADRILAQAVGDAEPASPMEERLKRLSDAWMGTARRVAQRVAPNLMDTEGLEDIEVVNRPADINPFWKFVAAPINLAIGSKNAEVIGVVEDMIALDVERNMTTEARKQEARFVWDSIPESERNEAEFAKYMDEFHDPATIDTDPEFSTKSQAWKNALKWFKEREEIRRQEIIDTKREGVARMLKRDNATRLVDRAAKLGFEWEITRDPSGRKVIRNDRGTLVTLDQARADLVKKMVSDDWGMQYAHFFHWFNGEYKLVGYKEDGTREIIGSAMTEPEAFERLYAYKRANPGVYSKYSAEPAMRINPDESVRLSDAQRRRLEKMLADATGAYRDDVADAMRGIVASRTSKRPFYAPLMTRTGAKGFSTNFMEVWDMSERLHNRWKMGGEMVRQLTPRIEKIRRDTPGWGDYLAESMRHTLFTAPTMTEAALDSLVKGIPFIGKMTGPFFTRRMLESVRWMNYARQLITVRQQVVNSFQPLQTLYPILGEKGLMEAVSFYNSEEGKEVMRRFGYIRGSGKFYEGTESRLGSDIAEFVGNMNERIYKATNENFNPSSEARNQNFAFVAMYLHGKNKGMTDEEAARYGRVYGNVYTQFYYTKANIPWLLRGPVASTALQYRRFAINTTGLLVNEFQRGNYSGVARYMAVMSMLGGVQASIGFSLASLIRSAYLGDKEGADDLTFKIRQWLRSELGSERMADVAMMGLPAAIGIDLSGSISIWQKPFGRNLYEKVGASVSGPTVNTLLQMYTNLTAETTVPTGAAERTAQAIADSSPAAQQIITAWKLFSGDNEYYDAQGRLRYRLDPEEQFLKMGAFRTVSESVWSMEYQRLRIIRNEVDKYADRAATLLAGGKTAEARKALREFNSLYPMASMTFKDIQKRVENKRMARKVPQLERRVDVESGVTARAIAESEGIGR